MNYYWFGKLINRCTKGIPMLLLLCQPFLYSQQTQHPFDYNLSTAQFRGAQNMTCLEIYISLSREALTFVPDEEVNLKAAFTVSIQIHQGDSLINERTWNNVTHAKDDSEIVKNQQLFAQSAFHLVPGDYRFSITVLDMYSDKQKKKVFDHAIISFAEENLSMSEIEFCVSLRKDTQKNQFYKNGYHIVPNPTSFFGTGLAILYFYSEIYNLKYTGPDDTSKYAVQRQILDSQGKVARDYGEKIKSKPGHSAVEIGGVNIITQKSGTYFFNIKVTDLATNEIAETKRKFFIYRKGDFVGEQVAERQPEPKVVKSELFSDARYTSMSEKELDEEFETTRYISTKEERKIFDKLDLKGKQSFLVEFWKRRDSDPSTRRNEFRDEYLSRAEYANSHFTSFKKGWKTDRGRVLLMYGEPDEIERVPFSSENKPYEIWKYFSVQGGVEFYFVDKRGFGTMEMVHSTARGELHDTNWQRWTSTGSDY
ncbi:GWxTD domain-containing protein [candidate division KSB1 bacterium]|nr:GWxTD domain-containing protein [candidate division KSB1 bacterium]